MGLLAQGRGGEETPFSPLLCCWCVIGQTSASYQRPTHRVPPSARGEEGGHGRESGNRAMEPQCLENQAREWGQGAWHAAGRAGSKERRGLAAVRVNVIAP